MKNDVKKLEGRSLNAILGSRTAAMLEKNLGLETVIDLLNYFPRKCLVRGQLTAISELPQGENVTLLAEVIKSGSRSLRHRKGDIYDVTIADRDNAVIVVSFFNAYRARQELRPGKQVLLSGKVGEYRGRITLTNPDFMVLQENHPTGQDHGVMDFINRPIPVYPATAKVSSWVIAKIIQSLLEDVEVKELIDPIPSAIAEAEKIPSLSRAYLMIHRPTTLEDYQKAKRRFRFQEAFMLQAVLAQRREIFGRQNAVPRSAKRGLVERFDRSLPFKLTDEQRNAGKIIAQRLQTPHPMNVLLQGDVGSGKTLVALRAMLQTVSGGGQAVLLAPTEVLATQHFYNILSFLGELGRQTDTTLLGMSPSNDSRPVNVSLLTGSLSDKRRKVVLLDIASGAANIIIGTHAVQSKDVSYFDLALIVVDEQHRFGVEQRASLRQKEKKADAFTGEIMIPHTLTMTATPIPRTVAMMVFGDLEMVTLKQLPAGRQEIETHVVDLTEHPGWYDRVWERAYEEIQRGRQVYIVCPAIFADEKLKDRPEKEEKKLASVEKTAEELSKLPLFSETAIGVLHGGLDIAGKVKTMRAFENNEINMLIATTMIEVGVDVPNATLMIVLSAERFGMSQLHQLRGRVGRGRHAGTCLLVTRSFEGDSSRQRLEAIAATTDGFTLAREDMKLRREGDILGTSQWGTKSTLKFLRVMEHGEVIDSARIYVSRIFYEDPQLRNHRGLKNSIETMINQEESQFLEQT